MRFFFRFCRIAISLRPEMCNFSFEIRETRWMTRAEREIIAQKHGHKEK